MTIDKTKPHVVTEQDGTRTHYLGEVQFKIAPETTVGNPPPKTEGK